MQCAARKAPTLHEELRHTPAYWAEELDEEHYERCLSEAWNYYCQWLCLTVHGPLADDSDWWTMHAARSWYDCVPKHRAQVLWPDTTHDEFTAWLDDPYGDI